MLPGCSEVTLSSLPRTGVLGETAAPLGEQQHIPLLEPRLAVHSAALDDQPLPAVEVVTLRLGSFGEIFDRQRRLQFHLRVAAVAVVERVAVECVVDLATRGSRHDQDGQERRVDRTTPMGIHGGSHL